MRRLERFENIAYPYIFRKAVPFGQKGTMKMELTGHGYITQIRVNFVAGESGTLHIRPYVLLNGEIVQELVRYSNDGEQYLSGDSVTYELPCYQEIEANAMLCVYYENTSADAESSDSQIMVDVIVQYDGYTEPRNVIG